MNEKGEINTGQSEQITRDDIEHEINIQASLTPEENAIRTLKLKRESYKDPLTGMKNRKALSEEMETIVQILSRKNGELTVLFIDIDNLKRINDTKGHKEGNSAIKNIGEELKNNIRKSDIAGKGTRGDEFIVILNGTDESGTFSFYERLTKSIETNEQLALSDVSISMGASSYQYKDNHPVKSFDELLSEADKAMYEAKKRKGEREGKVGLIFYNEIKKR